MSGAGEPRFAWAEAGTEEVADQLFRIPLPLRDDPLRAVNAYLWRSEGGDLLIDCGWAEPGCWETLGRELGRLGSSPRAIRIVFATHVHGDHLGAAGLIREAGQGLVLLGLGDRESAELWATRPEVSRERTRELLRQHGSPELALRLELEEAERGPERSLSPLPDLYLVGGQLRFGERQLEVLPTPGHTRGHLCLWDEAAGVLFAGDHVLPQITPSIAVEAPAPGLPLLRFLESLERVRSLPARLVLPAHGPVFTGLSRRVDELLTHHQERLQLCLEQVLSGRRTAMAVAAALPWTRRRRRLEELDAFNQMLAVNETIAHLELLVARAALSRVVSDLGVEFLPPAEGATAAAKETP